MSRFAAITVLADNMRESYRSNRTVALAIALWPCVHGCQHVDGGAVELSWKLRPASSSLEDKFVDCESGKPGTGPIDKIRLEWFEGDTKVGEEWSCGDSHGVTGFALPPGPNLFSVVPICENEVRADLEAYIAPAAEQRDVILGDTVSLGAIELVVRVTDCIVQRCICQ